jgi:hypothetical protein
MQWVDYVVFPFFNKGLLSKLLGWHEGWEKEPAILNLTENGYPDPFIGIKSLDLSLKDGPILVSSSHYLLRYIRPL